MAHWRPTEGALSTTDAEARRLPRRTGGRDGREGSSRGTFGDLPAGWAVRRYATTMTVWTIGHSTRALEELVELLRAHGVDTVADVRTVPRSRRHPQFGKTALTESLPQAAIAYTHMPGLGGLRKPRADSSNTGLRNQGFRGYADYMQ